jgi:hypothetical protein
MAHHRKTLEFAMLVKNMMRYNVLQERSKEEIMAEDTQRKKYGAK